MRPLAIAHRGDPYAFRENTLAAFAAAVRAGADMVEIDVRRTADGAVVVLHDPTLERLWGIPRAVAELTLDEVQGGAATAAAGSRSSREVLEAVRAPLMVDYTDGDVVEPALEARRRGGRARPGALLGRQRRRAPAAPRRSRPRRGSR